VTTEKRECSRCGADMDQDPDGGQEDGMKDVEKMVFAVVWAKHWTDDQPRAYCAIRASEAVYDMRLFEWSSIDWSQHDIELATAAQPEELRVTFEEVTR